MDISTMGTVLAIVVITYLIGLLCKSLGSIRDELIPVIGVITKAGKSREQLERCEKELLKAGVQPPFYRVVFPSGEGIDELERRLNSY